MARLEWTTRQVLEHAGQVVEAAEDTAAAFLALKNATTAEQRADIRKAHPLLPDLLNAAATLQTVLDSDEQKGPV
ncbi:hypothetical protein EVJ50_13145 [Synechococcus sp. RSCCF101]|uniref:hypothetical protein n=1 Tax=Synechococcus sp. RSCCF101 TaxID=2511069 RepID=UPI00124718EA|nr:hypothetical protein [Synechococcus sp. RSCCF101]QEY33033.1 hypothetical protein EVJ50_13145 [Synechococcus sp. RSCCF101]